MIATSLAHEYCGSFGSPVQFANSVFSAPSSFARLFILSQNAPSLPQTRSAIATQESFAEHTAILFNSASA